MGGKDTFHYFLDEVSLVQRAWKGSHHGSSNERMLGEEFGITTGTKSEGGC